MTTDVLRDDAVLALAAGSSQLVTPPATEPLSLAMAKAHLRVEHTEEDQLIDAITKAARKRLETWLSWALLTQTWEYALDAAPCAGAPILLPIVPLQAVTSITTYDPANVGTVFAASNYLVDTISQPGRVILNEGTSWPTGLRAANAVVTRYVAGFTDAHLIPEDLGAALSLLIGHLYEHREIVCNEELFVVPHGIQALAAPYRLVRP